MTKYCKITRSYNNDDLLQLQIPSTIFAHCVKVNSNFIIWNDR
jgi:hypothetical protein